MNKKQLSNILGAGTITGFILALMLLFNNGDVQGETAVLPTTSPSGITEVVPMENYSQLQAQNDQLVQDLQVMQSREQQYEAQITTANEMMAQQSAAAQQTGNYDDEYEEHEEHEEDDHEYESDDD